ncbi:Protein hu-li tai shao [Thelohanellus kitauei]|uniref:Protein hu-li tai shao n=1 Tax=Thelohanellus kitauei TaxID=669202 RepID=A0A0C2N0Y5_THEKT|nr:Protein hu-li tai shao [Thelohanellus kitauei]
MGINSLNCTKLMKTVSINDLIDPDMTEFEKAFRLKLAQLFHILRLYDAQDSIYDQISYKLSENEFLINPFGLMAWEITAAKLIKIDALSMALGNNFAHNHRLKLFSHIYSLRPDVRCLVNLQTIEMHAFSCLEQRRVVYGLDAGVVGKLPVIDFKYEFDSEFFKTFNEQLRGLCRVIVLKNYGAIVMAKTIEEAFFLSYHLQRIASIELKLKNVESVTPHISENIPGNSELNNRGLEVSEFDAHLRLIREHGIINDWTKPLSRVERTLFQSVDEDTERTDQQLTSPLHSELGDDQHVVKERGYESDTSDTAIELRFSQEQIPLIESHKELAMKISSNLASDVGQMNFEEAYKCPGKSRRIRSAAFNSRFIRRSKSLSGVERALFRKTAEDFLNQNK